MPGVTTEVAAVAPPVGGALQPKRVPVKTGEHPEATGCAWARGRRQPSVGNLAVAVSHVQ